MDVTAIISDDRQLLKLPAGIKHVKLNAPTSPLEPLIALRLNRLGATKVFSPMQTMGSFGKKYKLILTLHDLIYYRHPAPPPSFNFAIRLLWRLYHLTYSPQRWLLNRADQVVTVSKTTQQLIHLNRLTRKPVSVIYNAADSAENHVRNFPENRKLIYMGSFMDYKNVEMLIEGMQQLPGCELRLLSRIDSHRRQQLEKIASNNGGKVTFVNGVTDSEYNKELVEGFALVHASRDEGFGIPLVEAMVRGVPVVVSDIPIFREIGEPAAMFFETVSEFVSAIRQLENENLWIQKSIESQKRAMDFSWQKSAIKLMALLERL